MRSNAQIKVEEYYTYKYTSKLLASEPSMQVEGLGTSDLLNGLKICIWVVGQSKRVIQA